MVNRDDGAPGPLRYCFWFQLQHEPMEAMTVAEAQKGQQFVTTIDSGGKRHTRSLSYPFSIIPRCNGSRVCPETNPLLFCRILGSAKLG